jgi:hypothetical protein
MKKVLIVLLLAGAVYACNQLQGNDISSPPPVASIPIKFCDSGSGNSLCSYLPIDLDTNFSVGYNSFLDSGRQIPFDMFSWQTFVALNWPADAQGRPTGGSIGNNTGNMRVWEYYQDPAVVFNKLVQQPLLLHMGNAKQESLKFFYMDSKSPKALMPVRGFQEADGHPLIDRNLNFALYEIKMNPVEVDFVKKFNLQTTAGIDSFYRSHKKKFSLPMSDSATGNPGSIEIKASWRILDPSKGDDTTRFYCRNALIYIDSAHTTNGKPLLVRAKVGLVGMHIIRKTHKFAGKSIWTTFEHVDNTPDNPQEAQQNPNKRWSFYNPACLNCVPNDTPAFKEGDNQQYRWNPTPPYAARYAVYGPSQNDVGPFGTQAVRVYPIYKFTEELNNAWRAKLKGTVWANYRLIGSQWQKGEVQYPPNAPALLANTTLETYIQPTASCITCHGGAYVISGKDTIYTDLSFIFPVYAK